MDPKLLDLPYEVQLYLASGYLAYIVASGGLEKNHKATDTIFHALIYSVIAKIIGYNLVQDILIICSAPSYLIKYIPWVTGFSIPIVLAVCWKKYLKRIIIKRLQDFKITTENYRGTTLNSIIEDDYKQLSFISIKRIDGSHFDSDLAAISYELPENSLITKNCDIDEEGNIAIYVTKVTDPNGKELPIPIKGGVLDENRREHLNYIPASQIAGIVFSREKK
ncbi:hypothetical protein O4H49_04035 [Kiloniella laminariae]|uniref:SMODS-associating 2TM beta-strand rich effector domain-containing protein n=1 Tax=Kiloniella laminariae TaxID=454162 RepID=A0ABT4LFR5_9PROT|nr:hypothetical protein [Kiloniella laminariae]MCZ4279934.1 hypothetical protein [Kiloniella laminariae]